MSTTNVGLNTIYPQTGVLQSSPLKDATSSLHSPSNLPWCPWWQSASYPPLGPRRGSDTICNAPCRPLAQYPDLIH